MANQPKMVPKRKYGPPLGYPCHGSGGFSGCCCLTLNQANHCDEHRTRTKQPATYRRAICTNSLWLMVSQCCRFFGRPKVSRLKSQKKMKRISIGSVSSVAGSWSRQHTIPWQNKLHLTSCFTHMISDSLIPSSLSHAPLSRNKICIKYQYYVYMYICIHTYKSSLLLLSKMLFFAKEMQVFWTYVELLWLWLQYRTPI